MLLVSGMETIADNMPNMAYIYDPVTVIPDRSVSSSYGVLNECDSFWTWTKAAKLAKIEKTRMTISAPE